MFNSDDQFGIQRCPSGEIRTKIQEKNDANKVQSSQIQFDNSSWKAINLTYIPPKCNFFSNLILEIHSLLC